MSEGKIDGMPIEEMAIVDIFTKLIFDAEAELDALESLLVEQLCRNESSLHNAGRRDISEYLRSMPVDEMISVVASLKQQVDRQQALIANQQSHHASSIRH